MVRPEPESSVFSKTATAQVFFLIRKEPVGKGQKMKKEPIILLANACIWGLVMILTSLALKGTGAYQEIQHILAGGAAFSLLMVAGVFRRKSKCDPPRP
jgi:hypothetical protein